MRYYLAVDIGASSGRHILGHVADGSMMLEEVYRFENRQVRKNGHDCWDMEHLWRSILEGLRACREIGKIPSMMGVDTWAVDFVLVDADGNSVSDAVAYRDDRTRNMDAVVEESIPFQELYERTGIQKQPFNTIYQLIALQKEHPEQLEAASRLLMLPDYFNFRLTGVMKNEYTNATSTSLVNARSKNWDWDIIHRLGLPSRIFGELRMASETVGHFTAAIQEEVGFDCEVVLPATHDTGSAFLAVPARDDRAVYLSSGTGSLLGVENMEPITNENSRLANFTNEGGYGYRFRYLKNIMGLWMIQSIRRELNGISYVEGREKRKTGNRQWSYAELENEARACNSFPSRVDVNDAVFLAPSSMIREVKAFCEQTGQAAPQNVGELMQCVYGSLAAGYGRAVAELSALTGKQYTSVNIVGGGSKDGYLNELTANAVGLPVFAGPAEGTAVGNLMVQFIRGGEYPDLETARAAIYKSFSIKEVLP